MGQGAVKRRKEELQLQSTTQFIHNRRRLPFLIIHLL
jgi:hypothetical protein